MSIGAIKKSLDDLKDRLDRASSIKDPLERVPLIILLLKKRTIIYIELIDCTKKSPSSQNVISTTIEKLKSKIIDTVDEMEALINEYVYNGDVIINIHDYEKYCSRMRFEYSPNYKTVKISQDAELRTAVGFDDEKHRERLKCDNSEEVIGKFDTSLIKGVRKLDEDDISLASKLADDPSLQINVKKCIGTYNDDYKW
jgi:hypothetical protein